MKKKSRREFLIILIALIGIMVNSGCKCTHKKGAREYIPGKGWKPVD